MAIADFVHLKVRSAYSLTEGANKIEKIVALAKEQSMPAVAVTDRNNLFGALEFSQYASKAGIQPIVGCDLGIRREEEGGIATAGKLAAADWLTLLVQSETGYRNLMRLVSRAHLDFKTGSLCALPLEMLDGHTDGLLAFTGSAGSSLGRLLSAGQTPAATHLLERLQRAVRRSPVHRTAAPRPGRRAAHRRHNCSISPIPRVCRWSRPTTCISPRPRCTRRTTCCSASSRACISRIPTAAA